LLARSKESAFGRVQKLLEFQVEVVECASRTMREPNGLVEAVDKRVQDPAVDLRNLRLNDPSKIEHFPQRLVGCAIEPGVRAAFTA